MWLESSPWCEYKWGGDTEWNEWYGKYHDPKHHNEKNRNYRGTKELIDVGSQELRDEKFGNSKKPNEEKFRGYIPNSRMRKPRSGRKNGVPDGLNLATRESEAEEFMAKSGKTLNANMTPQEAFLIYYYADAKDKKCMRVCIAKNLLPTPSALTNDEKIAKASELKLAFYAAADKDSVNTEDQVIATMMLAVCHRLAIEKPKFCGRPKKDVEL